MADVKFCGLTRATDAELALELGAAYIGVILAGGPRMLDHERASAIAAIAPTRDRAVAVFGRSGTAEIVRAAERIGAGVAQLHGDPTAADVIELRGDFPGEIWAVARVDGGRLPHGIEELFVVADAVLLDPRVSGMPGGTGVTLPWQTLAVDLAAARSGARARLILAGGLSPENVGEAMEVLGPDVVDVSSGVELAPGIKDHDRMRDFAAAVRKANG